MGKSEGFCLCSWGPCSVDSGCGHDPAAVVLDVHPLQVSRCSGSAIPTGFHALVKT